MSTVCNRGIPTWRRVLIEATWPKQLGRFDRDLIAQIFGSFVFLMDRDHPFDAPQFVGCRNLFNCSKLAPLVCGGPPPMTHTAGTALD